MLVSLSILITLKWIDEHFLMQVQSYKAFTATDSLISQSFVDAFIHPTYVQIALIWGFPVQLSL